MDTKLVKKFLAFMQGNDVKTDVLLDYKNTISVGEFHFENGVHFPALIPGLKADGVYIDKEYIIGNCEREKETTLSRAKNYCENRGCILPPPKARDNMIYGGEGLNLMVALQTLGFQPIEGREYWAQGDKAYVPDSGSLGDDRLGTVGWAPDYARKRVRGCKRVSAKLTFSVESLLSPYGWLLGELLRPDFSYQKYLEGLGTRFPVAGWYLMKDGTFCVDTVYDREAGICVTPNLCLILRIHGEQMTVAETLAYKAFYGLEMPTEEHLLLMQKYAGEINQALDAIDMGDVHIPVQDVTEKCWSAEALRAASNEQKKSTEKRWYFPISKLKTVPEIYAILAELGVGKTKE